VIQAQADIAEPAIVDASGFLKAVQDFLYYIATKLQEPDATEARLHATNIGKAQASLAKASQAVGAIKEAVKPLPAAAETVEKAAETDAAAIAALAAENEKLKADSKNDARLILTIIGALLIAGGVAAAWLTKNLWLGGAGVAAGAALIVVTWVLAWASAHPVIAALVGLGLVLGLVLFGLWKAGVLDKVLGTVIAGVEKAAQPAVKATIATEALAAGVSDPLNKAVQKVTAMDAPKPAPAPIVQPSTTPEAKP
jgi:hypothetical protein